MKYNFQTKPNKVVLYMDMLGFRNAILENDNDEEKRNEVVVTFPAIEKILKDMFPDGNNGPVRFLWMSDSFMLSSNIADVNDLLWYMFEIQHVMLISDLPVRGALCIGRLYHEKNIWGEALVRAVEIEETKSIYPRILVEEKDFVRLPISEEYQKYFKSDSETPGYKYVEPISYSFDCALNNAFSDSNGIWSSINVLTSHIEQQYLKASGNESVQKKWKWLANVFISVICKNKSRIEEALIIDQQVGMQAQTYDECIARLHRIVQWNGV